MPGHGPSRRNQQDPDDQNEENQWETGDYASRQIVLYFTPAVITAGVFGNVMILFVIPRMQHRRAFFFYAYARGISDLAVLLGIVFPRWIVNIVQRRLTTKDNWFCRLQTFAMYFFISVSFLCLAAMAAQRACVVLWPFKSRAIKQVRVAKSVIVAIIIYTFLCQVSNLVGTPLDTEKCYVGGPISFRKNLVGRLQTWGNFVNYIAVPTSIAVGTSIIVFAQARSQRITLKSHGNSHRSQTDSDTSLLVTITLVYCILSSPAVLIEALITSDLVSENSIPSICFTVMVKMIFTCSAVNFYIYYLMGKTFRLETMRVLQNCLCLPALKTKTDYHRSGEAGVPRPSMELTTSVNTSISEGRLQILRLNPAKTKRQPEELKVTNRQPSSSSVLKTGLDVDKHVALPSRTKSLRTKNLLQPLSMPLKCVFDVDSHTELPNTTPQHSIRNPLQTSPTVLSVMSDVDSHTELPNTIPQYSIRNPLQTSTVLNVMSDVDSHTGLPNTIPQYSIRNPLQTSPTVLSVMSDVDSHTGLPNTTQQ